MAYLGVNVKFILFAGLFWLGFTAIVIVFWANNYISGKY